MHTDNQHVADKISEGKKVNWNAFHTLKKVFLELSKYLYLDKYNAQYPKIDFSYICEHVFLENFDFLLTRSECVK